MSFELGIFGLMSIVGGLVTLRRGSMKDFYPAAPVSLFIQPKTPHGKQRPWVTRLGVIEIMLGCFMVLLAVFYHR
jgi:hypothetical protein